jgi:hypothetical protein
VADGTRVAFFSWVAIIFIAGAADRILVSAGFGCEEQVWFFGSPRRTSAP